jgi:hypothetical protein
MTDPAEVIERLNDGVALFAEEMKAQGIHVGIGQGGGKVVCPVDGEDWPCSAQHVCTPSQWRGEKIGWQCDCGKVLR